MQIIFNADDFGRSTGINTAVVRAHRQGVLTSASLMVNEGGFEEAVELARENPALAVGLHIVVAQGRSALSRKEIPHLVNEQGYFPSDLLRIGFRYHGDREIQEELKRELIAQFERFAATGLPLSHVDGHLHMHLHPTVFNLLLPLAKKYGAKGIRVPRDELWPALRQGRRRAATKIAWAIIFGLLCRWCLKRLRNQGLIVTHRVYGLMQTGQMQQDYVIGLLKRLDVPTAEFFFHPAEDARSEALGPNRADLETLLSPAVRRVIQELRLELATYSSLYSQTKQISLLFHTTA